MVFRNMEKLELKDVSRVMKVGDTVSDILEGKNAGLVTVGILEGSSVMGLTQEEYEALSEKEREAADKKAEDLSGGRCRLRSEGYAGNPGSDAINRIVESKSHDFLCLYEKHDLGILYKKLYENKENNSCSPIWKSL